MPDRKPALVWRQRQGWSAEFIPPSDVATGATRGGLKSALPSREVAGASAETHPAPLRASDRGWRISDAFIAILHFDPAAFAGVSALRDWVGLGRRDSPP